MKRLTRRTAVMGAAAVALACDTRRRSPSDRQLPPPPPAAEPTGPTPLPPGRVPTAAEIAHLTLSISDGTTSDSVALRRGRFAGARGGDSVVVELLAADGTPLADTGRAAMADLDGSGEVESALVLAVRRGGAIQQRLVVVGDRSGFLGELASSSLGGTVSLRQVALIGTRDGADVRLTLRTAAQAHEVRWYRLERARNRRRLRMLADTVGGTAAPLAPDPLPRGGHSHR